MSSFPSGSSAALVNAIDLMARAVFTWVRQEAMEHRFRGVSISTDEQCALAAGFIAGLRSRIGLGDSEAALLAYVYALMTGERAGAAALVVKLLAQQDGDAKFSCSGYLNGLQAARTLLCEFQRVRLNLPAESLSELPVFIASGTALN
jgi:hypothetical protein